MTDEQGASLIPLHAALAERDREIANAARFIADFDNSKANRKAARRMAREILRLLGEPDIQRQ